MNYKFIVLFGLLMLASSVLAQEYYADVTFDVTSTGEVNISGTTNHPMLQTQTTQELTTKTGSTWEIKESVEGVFSEYIYEIRLPINAQIIEINTTDIYRITNKEGRLTIIGTGEQKPLKFNIKYSLNTNPEQNYLLFGLILLIIAGGGYAGIKIIPKLQKKKEKPTYNKEALTERQLKLVDYLEKANSGVTQAEIQKHFNWPKASISRNLETLEKKGIITKERKGMTMLVSLKKN